MRSISLALTALFSAFSLASAAKRDYETHNYYVLEHDARQASLTEISRALAVEVVDRVGELPNHWLVRAPKALAAREGSEESRDLVLETYTRLRARSPDAALSARDEEVRMGAALKYLSRQSLRQRVKRAPIPLQEESRQESEEDTRAVALRFGIKDPLFSKQWHLVNDDALQHSMNVAPVWEMGFTGKGVISSFIDDGLDYTSEDLKDNFDAENSYDFNDHEPLPTPKLADDTHGTRCAGQVAAGKNDACGIGIAYDSKVAGLRILSGMITDVDEATALNYGFQNVSVYSCSWGPPDTGTVMGGPEHLINKAVVNGVNTGRGGKGSIFVFASGNGAHKGDQCNFDGYTNSIYSVTVSAVDINGVRGYYSEGCTANMIAAYSSGSKGTPHITTTDKGRNKCTAAHSGTSAAAPNAVGVFALALQARPDLTWRDIQHLCVETARMTDPDDDSWELTAAGRNYSSKYGFGVLDGALYVQAAQKWELVKPQTRMATSTVQIEGGTMNSIGNYTGGEVIGVGGVSSVMGIKWDMLQDANFEKLEHITVRVWIEHTRRGDVRVELRSPNGVTSVLAEPRQLDIASTGFPGWTFMTLKHWGEDPVGDWMITVSDQGSQDQHGRFLGWDMVFWGSAIDPAKAVLYEPSPDDPVLPPHDQPQSLPPSTATTTKSYTNPTKYLTTGGSSPTSQVDSIIAEDAASTTGAESFPTATPSEAPSQIAKLLQALQRKLVVVVILVAAISFGGGVLVWRHAFHRPGPAAAPYISLPADRDEDDGRVQMSDRRRSVGAGDGSDDEADERTGLNSGPYQHVGFHSGFLDDDDEHEYPPSAGRVSPAYRDEDRPS